MGQKILQTSDDDGPNVSNPEIHAGYLILYVACLKRKLTAIKRRNKFKKDQKRIKKYKTKQLQNRRRLHPIERRILRDSEESGQEFRQCRDSFMRPSQQLSFELLSARFLHVNWPNLYSQNGRETSQHYQGECLCPMYLLYRICGPNLLLPPHYHKKLNHFLSPTPKWYY